MTGSIAKALDFVRARRKAGLSDETMHVLLHLCEEVEDTRDGIAAATGINPTTLPRYLSRLIDSGHLQKQQCFTDLRVVRFSLSEHGHRLVENLLRHFPA